VHTEPATARTAATVDPTATSLSALAATIQFSARYGTVTSHTPQTLRHPGRLKQHLLRRSGKPVRRGQPAGFGSSWSRPFVRSIKASFNLAEQRDNPRRLHGKSRDVLDLCVCLESMRRVMSNRY
jgi:hypothetical protein